MSCSMDLLGSSQAYLQHCEAAGFPVRNNLIRPETLDKKGFKSQPVSSSAMYQRMVGHLKRLGLYEGTR